MPALLGRRRVVGRVNAALYGAAGAGVALGAYALSEPYRFRIAEHRLPLRVALPELVVLHVSDTHLTARRTSLLRFLKELPVRLGVVPDLVVATGDLIDDDSGIEPLVEAFARLEARLGRFYVLGSHDYYVSGPNLPTKYFTGRHEVSTTRRADSARLEEGLQAKGWTPLTNTTELVDAPFGRIRMAGVDDPYIGRHSTGHLERGRDDVLAIGLVHSPDVVSQWALAGFDLVLAGHTHGGQVRAPGVGALVTNCSLPAALASGPHRIGATWLHVSPGLGNSRFSPIRFNCRPEATLLRLHAA